MTPEHPDRSPPATPIGRRDEGLSVPQAAKRLGVHAQTVRNWIRNWEQQAPSGARLPYSWFGARKLIHPNDLERVRGE